MQQDEKRGELREKREILLALMITESSSVSAPVIRRVKAIRNSRRFNALLKKGFTASAIEDMGIE